MSSIHTLALIFVVIGILGMVVSYGTVINFFSHGGYSYQEYRSATSELGEGIAMGVLGFIVYAISMSIAIKTRPKNQ